MDKTVVELFAGVGGFRVGLNNVKLVKGKVKETPAFDFVWANQWEPSTKAQHAFDCYITRFGNTIHHSNEDISTVNKKSIPDHTLLVGGFPCQDYSVARSLSKEQGIQGKKGVLWWEIHEILKVKRPPFVLLENVDRLLKSPSKQRGRDFGVMLRSMNDLGYGVEWRIINAADYGFAQRRRRVFIFGFHKSTNHYKSMKSLTQNELLVTNGLFASSFQ
jgi:DNA (cytosine-5)-methyltransferase 1